FHSPLWRERAFEYHRDDGRDAALYGKLQLGQPRRIDDGFDRTEQDFDNEVDGDVLADEPLAASFAQELAERALNHFPPSGLHQLKQVRRLPLDVTHKRRPNLVGMLLYTSD